MSLTKNKALSNNIVISGTRSDKLEEKTSKFYSIKAKAWGDLTVHRHQVLLCLCDTPTS